jgi:uncharacterized membrane protein
MMNPELGKNRIEALSDGIFAIVMTLLVLELHVPELPAAATNHELAPALWKLWPHFLTYAASFVSLGIYWVAHHNMYHAIRRSNRALLCLNILFFMLVSLLPFSTSVLNAFKQTQVALLFFGANVALIGWALFAQWAYAGTQPEVFAPHATPAYRDLVGARFLAIPVYLTITVLVCFWSVGVSLAIFLLLLPFYLIPPKAGPGHASTLAPSAPPALEGVVRCLPH